MNYTKVLTDAQPTKNKTKTHRCKAGSSHLCDAGGSQGAWWVRVDRPAQGCPVWVSGTREGWLKRGLNHTALEGRRARHIRLESGQHPSPPPPGRLGLYPRGDPKSCSQSTSSTGSAVTPSARPLGAPGPDSGAFKVGKTGKTSLFLTAVF